MMKVFKPEELGFSINEYQELQDNITGALVHSFIAQGRLKSGQPKAYVLAGHESSFRAMQLLPLVSEKKYIAKLTNGDERELKFK